VLLTAPQHVILCRLPERTHNQFGKTDVEQAQVLSNLHEVEPLLRRAADIVIDSTPPLAKVADQILKGCAAPTT
jgi:hypothetical protein